MALPKSILLVSLICSFANANVIRTDDLVALVQVFRHGERTPVAFYKNDPYKDYWGDLDVGQLTNEGRRQLHSLGQLTRSRYSDWIPTKYNKKFFYAQTTDIDRTHMSGQSYLYGLFPATDEQVWLENVNWQAIPLHPVNPSVWPDLNKCPAYEPLLKNLFASDEFVQIDEENADLYAYLSEHTGENITDLEGVTQIYDCLKIENGVGLSIPEWAQEVFPEPLKALSGLGFKSLTYTTQLKRLFAGTLLNEIVVHFENMAVNASSSPQFQVYSAHDSNIAAILNSFGSLDPPYPPEFAATIWLELRKHNNVPYVNVWSKNGDNITQVSINGCDLDCTLDEFRTRLSSIILDVDTWTAECYSNV